MKRKNQPAQRKILIPPFVTGRGPSSSGVFGGAVDVFRLKIATTKQMLGPRSYMLEKQITHLSGKNKSEQLPDQKNQNEDTAAPPFTPQQHSDHGCSICFAPSHTHPTPIVTEVKAQGIVRN